MSEFPDFSNLYYISPFNSQLILDSSCLGENYHEFRRSLFLKTRDESSIGEKVQIEKFRTLTGDVQENAINEWLSPVQKKKGRQFSHGVGETEKDKSIITITPNHVIEYDKSISKYNIFAANPKIEVKLISIHEYGVGLVWIKMKLKFTDAISNHPILGPHDLISDFIQNMADSKELCGYLKEIDDILKAKADEVMEQIQSNSPIFSFEDLYPNELSGSPKWVHAIYEAEEMDENVLQMMLSKNIEISHEQGPIDFIKDRQGFAHVGWQNTIWMNIAPKDWNLVFEGLRFAVVKWRQLEILGKILYSRIHSFAGKKTFKREEVQNNIDIVNKIRLAMEIYSADQQNIIQNMSTITYNIYAQTKISWRISEMEEFIEKELETFELLNENGRSEIKAENDRREAASDKQLNLILFIFTAISLVSTFVDVILFLDPEINTKIALPLRLIFILIGPASTILLVVFLIRLRRSRRT